MEQFQRVFLILFALGVSVPAVHAYPVFSNINGVLCSCGETPYIPIAEAFTPASDFLLTGAEALLYNPPESGFATMNFSLYSDSGNVPGTLLTSLGSVPIYGSGSQVYSASGPITATELFAGVQYWLVLDTSGVVTWEAEGSSAQPFADEVNGVFYNDTTNTLQFQINGTPIAATPEPANAWLCLSALLATLAAALFKRRHIRTSRVR